MTSGSVATELTFEVGSATHAVSGLLWRPANADTLLVLAHGAGAGMRHAFMRDASAALAERGIATLRYQFPYMQQGRRRPSPRPLLLATVRAAAAEAARRAGDLRLLAGGKSKGGRMTSLAAAEQPLPGVEGLVFFGFPLHPAGRPGTERADHLADVGLPMLFLQGSRDKLADLELLTPICRGLGPRAHLHRVAGGDHSFHVLKRSGRTDAEAMSELADTTRRFASHSLTGSA